MVSPAQQEACAKLGALPLKQCFASTPWVKRPMQQGPLHREETEGKKKFLRSAPLCDSITDKLCCEISLCHTPKLQPGLPVCELMHMVRGAGSQG